MVTMHIGQQLCPTARDSQWSFQLGNAMRAKSESCMHLFQLEGDVDTEGCTWRHWE